MDKDQIFYIASYPKGLHKETYTKEEVLREFRSTLDDNKKSFFVWSPGWSRWITLDQSPSNSFYSSQNTPPPIPWRTCICAEEILSIFAPIAVAFLPHVIIGNTLVADFIGVIVGLITWFIFVDRIIFQKRGFSDMNFTTFLVLCMSISYPPVLAYCICKRIKKDVPKQITFSLILILFISLIATYLYNAFIRT